MYWGDEIGFPVKKVKLMTEGGKEVPGRRAIIREDTGGVLGVVSDRYQLVPHGDVFKAASQVSKEFGLGTEPDRVSVCKGGSVVFGRFFSQANGHVQVKVGDIVRVGVEIFNSYDGSMPVGLMLIAERLSCTNGMVVPETLTSFSVKHYPTLQLSDVRQYLGKVLQQVNRVAEKWHDWSETKAEEPKVREFFGEVFGHRKRSQLLVRYLQEREDDTVWGAYNFLTRHFSHELKPRRGRLDNLRWTQWNVENPVTESFYRFAWK